MNTLRFALAATGLTMLGGCNLLLGPQIEGSGVAVKQQRTVSSFSELNLVGSGDYTVTVGEPAHVEIEIDDNLQEIISSEVEGETLTIRPDQRYRSDLRLKADIKTEELSSLDVTGEGSVTLDGLDSAVFDSSVTGSGSLSASGKAGKVSISITGSGRIDLSDCPADTVEISITGSGHAIVHADQHLDVSITGSGTVEYTGDASIEKSVTGSGSLVNKNP